MSPRGSEIEQRRKRTRAMWERVRVQVWPDEVLILGTRYDGTYEGAPWCAWVGDPSWLDDAHAGDNAAASWWSDYDLAPIGRGHSPDEALADLRRVAALGADAFATERAKARAAREAEGIYL